MKALFSGVSSIALDVNHMQFDIVYVDIRNIDAKLHVQETP